MGHNRRDRYAAYGANLCRQGIKIMIKLTVIPRDDASIFNLLISKEVALRKNKKGTLHRSGAKKPGTQKVAIQAWRVAAAIRRRCLALVS
jgi:hypothetical protein